MAILINGMEIPEHCMDCPFMVSRDNDDCILQSDAANESFETWEQMKAGCPLIELPEPHGRLIDADAFDGVICNQVDLQNQAVDFHYDNCDCGFIDGLIFTRSRIRNAPTVIPASEEVET